MMYLRIVGLVGCSALLAGGYLALSASSRSAAQGAPKFALPSRAVARPGDAAETRPASLRKANEAPKPRSAAERKRFFEALREAQTQLLVDSFERETSDPSWHAEAERSMRALYAKPDFAGLKTSVECRRTLCRVDFSYVDSEGSKNAIRRLVTMHPWSGRSYTRTNPGARNGFSYVARQGAELPSVDLKSLSL